MNPHRRNLVLLATFIVVGAALVLIPRAGDSRDTISYSRFMRDVNAGKVSRAVITQENSGASTVTSQMKDGNQLHVVIPADPRDALLAMQQNSVDIELRSSSSWRPLANAIPFFLLLGFWIFMMFRLGNWKKLGTWS